MHMLVLSEPVKNILVWVNALSEWAGSTLWCHSCWWGWKLPKGLRCLLPGAWLVVQLGYCWSHLVLPLQCLPHYIYMEQCCLQKLGFRGTSTRLSFLSLLPAVPAATASGFSSLPVHVSSLDIPSHPCLLCVVFPLMASTSQSELSI